MLISLRVSVVFKQFQPQASLWFLSGFQTPILYWLLWSRWPASELLLLIQNQSPNDHSEIPGAFHTRLEIQKWIRKVACQSLTHTMTCKSYTIRLVQYYGINLTSESMVLKCTVGRTHTCLNWDSDENVFVMPFMRLAKLNEPTPYLRREIRFILFIRTVFHIQSCIQQTFIYCVLSLFHSTHSVNMYSQFFLTKSQAKIWPSGLFAIYTITDVASCFLIFDGSSVYPRYLYKNKNNQNASIQYFYMG